MLFRQRAILGMIHAAHTLSLDRLNNLAFMIARECRLGVNEIYDFIPTKTGPYSFTMQHELQVLEQSGVITNRNGQYCTDSDEYFRCSVETRIEISKVVSKYRNVNDNELTSIVRREHKQYTKVPTEFCVNQIDGNNRRAIYTIGYEGLSLEEFLCILLHNHVTRLIDVRANPISRKFGFNAESLAEFCRTTEIEYVNIPQLGVRSSVRQKLTKGLTYQCFFDMYRESISRRVPFIEQAATYALDAPTAFMCKEINRDECHRKELGNILSKKTFLPIIELSEYKPMPKQLSFHL
jgi:hypothetical protein